jgi:gluconate 5-dehydrogenase
VVSLANSPKTHGGKAVAAENLFSLDGKRALVTGGGRGIGRAIALGLSDAGADVAVAARTNREIESVARLISENGRRGAAIPLDLLEAESREMAVEQARVRLGGLDILVNNAGAAPFSAPLAESLMPGWEKYLSLLLTAQAAVTQQVIRHWLAEEAPGVIINVASIYGFRGGPDISYYAVAKHGLIGLTRSLAVELADKSIRVNALCPGWVQTRMITAGREYAEERALHHIPMGRWAEPEEMVGPAVFLASDASSYMTGQTLVVDGGVLA